MGLQEPPDAAAPAAPRFVVFISSVSELPDPKPGLVLFRVNLENLGSRGSQDLRDHEDCRSVV